MSQWKLVGPLDGDDLTVVSEALQEALIVLVDVSLQAKQLHWNVVGPNFRSAHLLLDEVADTARTWSDTVAERLVSLGVPAHARASDVVAGPLGEVRLGSVTDSEAQGLLVKHLESGSELFRSHLPALEVDPVSHDLLVAALGAIEKDRWLLLASLAPSERENHRRT